ncbi:hypothetical protein Lal_00017228 [Lupinus albus]|nr:hypothetical protein Lal_00017228 [Lupinus albus]
MASFGILQILLNGEKLIMTTLVLVKNQEIYALHCQLMELTHIVFKYMTSDVGDIQSTSFFVHGAQICDVIYVN